jgi:glycerophosphoryl diester phosphodiesterase
VPVVVAHRGSSHAVAEHTLAAYEQAIGDGADALECDVRLTRDGHLVCVHDRRVERTSNGRGVVSEFALDELGDLDFGRWHDQLPSSADALVDPEPPPPPPAAVLTLPQLLELIVDASRPVQLYVETKHPNRYAGLVEQELVAALRRFGLADPPDPASSLVTLMSFAPMGVRRMRLLAPALPKVLLLNQVPKIRRDGSLPPGVGIAGPGIHVLRAHPEYARRVHEAGHRLYAWTIDKPTDLDLALALGSDMIATNRPREVLSRVSQRR